MLKESFLLVSVCRGVGEWPAYSRGHNADGPNGLPLPLTRFCRTSLQTHVSHTTRLCLHSDGVWTESVCGKTPEQPAGLSPESLRDNQRACDRLAAWVRDDRQLMQDYCKHGNGSFFPQGFFRRLKSITDSDCGDVLDYANCLCMTCAVICFNLFQQK